MRGLLPHSMDRTITSGLQRGAIEANIRQNGEPMTTNADNSSASEEWPAARAAVADDGGPPKSWPCVLALFTAPFLPATTARRTNQAWLGTALAVHLVALAAILLLDDVVRLLPFEVQVYLRITDNVPGFVTSFARLYGPLAGVVSLLCLEIITLLVAGLLMSWGAADEPLKCSYVHCLRRLWLQTGHLFIVVCLVHFIPAGARWADDVWRAREVLRCRCIQGPPPKRPPNIARGSEAEKAFFRQARPYWAARARLFSYKAPWYVRQGRRTATVASLALAWYAWALLRAMGTRRPVKSPDRPPTCVRCGYNLTGLPPDGRCPECGDAMANSIGPGVRPGTPWQRRKAYDWLAAAWRTHRQAAKSPKRLGRTIQLSDTSGAHRAYLAFVLALLLALVPVGQAFWWSVLVQTGWSRMSWPEWWRDLSVRQTLESWLVLVVCVVVISIATATVVALIHHVRWGRNLLAGTMQAAAYQTGLFVPWLFFLVLGLGAIAAMVLPVPLVPDNGYNLAPRLGRRGAILFLAVWALGNGLMLLVYFTRVMRTRRGFQHAVS